MSEITYKLQKPSIEEYKKLRDCVDWNLDAKGISKERALESLAICPLCVCAYDGDDIIGMVRLAGDLGMYGYIQDTIVMPGYQGRGIGRHLLKLIFEQIGDKRGYLLGVCPSKVSVNLYGEFGFKPRPKNPNGFMSIEFQ